MEEVGRAGGRKGTGWSNITILIYILIKIIKSTKT